MQVYRAICSCPNCFTFHEIWNYEGKISPQKLINCTECSLTFDPNNYILSFLDLYQDVSVSATQIADNAEIFLPVC